MEYNTGSQVSRHKITFLSDKWKLEAELKKITVWAQLQLYRQSKPMKK